MQTNRLRYLLPAALAGLTSGLGGQQTLHRVIEDGAWFHQSADGRRLARLARGAVVTVERTQNDWAEVRVDGWIFATSVERTDRDGYDLQVIRPPEENLRSAPNGALVGKLAQGFLLKELERQGGWVRVQRNGWIRRNQLEPVAVVASNRTAPATTGDSAAAPPARRPADSAAAPPPPRLGPPPVSVDARRAVTRAEAPLFRAPNSGSAAGRVEKGTPMRIISREGEWARVQFEGWVRAEDLAPAAGVLQGVTAAELRANPAAYQGQVLQWTLQFVSLAAADELRPEIPAGATYMLARGPLPERGFVYVIVPQAWLVQARALGPLSTIQVIARVRSARGRFLPHPVLELVALESAS